MFVDRVLSGMRPTGRMPHRPLPRRAQELGEAAGGVRVPVLRRGLARADHALRQQRNDLRVRLGDVRRLARRRDQSDARDDLHPVARARARRAHAAAGHDHAGGLARARADLQGPAAEARRPRPVQLRIPRLPGDAGRRHPDLPREHGAGGRGPGVAHRARARARAPLQLHLRPRGGVRGQGQGGGQEARRRRRRAATASCARRSRRRATPPRSRRRRTC